MDHTKAARDGENLQAVLGAFLDAQRTGRLDALTSLLAEDVEWRGPAEGSLCANRTEVLTLLGHRFSSGRGLNVTRLEAVEDGDRVIISVWGPDLRPPDVVGPPGAAHLVFTLRDGRVADMRGTWTREEAIAHVSG